MSYYKNHLDENGNFKQGEVYTINEAYKDFIERSQWDKEKKEEEKTTINPYCFNGIRAYINQTISPYYLSEYIDFCKKNNYPYNLNLSLGIKKIKEFDTPIQKPKVLYIEDLINNNELIDEVEQLLQENFININAKTITSFGKFIGTQKEYDLIDKLWRHNFSYEDIKKQVVWVTKRAYDIAKYSKFQSLSSLAKLQNEDLISLCVENNIKTGWLYSQIKEWGNLQIKKLESCIKWAFAYYLKNNNNDNNDAICWLNHNLYNDKIYDSVSMHTLQNAWVKANNYFNDEINRKYNIFYKNNLTN